MRHISILTVPQALTSSIAIPLEMISAADTIHRLRSGQKLSGICLQTVAESDSPMTMTGGLVLIPNTTLIDANQSELIFVPALWGNPRAEVRQHGPTVAWLAAQYKNGATICSVGSGSYFLAEAGLLDGRSATTHWRYFDDFQSRYPSIKLQRKRFVTHDQRLYCTGSINAVRDVMLHFVEQLFSSGIADEVARHFTHELKRSYESLLLAVDQQDTHHDELIIKVQEWLKNHYQQDIKMAEVAQRFGLNIRSFNRRFRHAANKTPVEYLQEVRINHARQLLKHSNLSISEITFAVGYQDVSYFTGLFRKQHEVTPNAYRRLVRSKIFKTGELP
jgi:transcriptional regulator GlxA family with amidase domain